MALTLDIKTNDALEKSALATAAALSRVADYEDKVNALATKNAQLYARSAKEASALAKYTEVYGKRTADSYGESKRIAEIGKKDRSKVLAQTNATYAAQKKSANEEKKRLKNIEFSGKAFAVAAGAVAAAATAALAFGAALAASAKNAGDSKREAKALVDAFTGGRGDIVLKKLDDLAQALGQSVDDVRGKFVEFRQAGLNIDFSGRLIKMRADIMALGLSASAADKEISTVTSAADGRYNIAAERKLRELAKAYHGAGSGALAAKAATETLEGAQNRLSNTAVNALADLWKKIGPEIGAAANRLADFAINVIKGEQGRKAIDALAEAFRNLSKAVNADNLNTALNVVKALAQSLNDVFRGISAVTASPELPLIKANKGVEANAKALEEKRAEIYGQSTEDAVTSGAYGPTAGTAAPRKSKKNEGGDRSTGGAKGEWSGESIAQLIGNKAQSIALPVAQEVSQQVTATISPRKSETPRTTTAPTTISLTINAPPGSDAEEYARIMRRELQLLLQAGALSRGYT